MSSMFDKFPLDQEIPGFFNGFDSRREMEEANREATDRLLEEMSRQDKARKQRGLMARRINQTGQIKTRKAACT